MNYKVVLILACLILVALVQGAVAIQTFDCQTGVAQNISPKDMGELQTVSVYGGSFTQLDGSEWRDAVTGHVPPVGFPGMSIANVTKGSHLLKISLKGYQDFEANVNICEQGVTEVIVRQVSVESTSALPAANPKVFPSAAAGTVPLTATTKAPGFELITAISAIATIYILRKDSFR